MRFDPLVRSFSMIVLFAAGAAGGDSYPIVDTGQATSYDDVAPITDPQPGEAFFGQDSQYVGNQPSHRDNGDGTVSDLNTGLMWQQTPLDDKLEWQEALAAADSFELAGYSDWRLPSVKELYSLIDFRGGSGASVETSVPYLDTDFFDFEYGDTAAGERLIDAQYWTSTEYVGTTMRGDATTFGVNFADGRIKGYPQQPPVGEFTAFVRYVRGNPDYGINDFVDNGDGTVTDQATGLMWMQADGGQALNWEEALAYAANLDAAGHEDWRLPDAKELQSIVDYTAAPDALDPANEDAAIDPVFEISNIGTEEEPDFPYFWTSTTHLEGNSSDFAVYLTFGEAWGYMASPANPNSFERLNVHGAGAQRSDPKDGDPADWPTGNGPQGDEVRIFNHARAVRTVPEPSPELMLGAAVALLFVLSQRTPSTPSLARLAAGAPAPPQTVETCRSWASVRDLSGNMSDVEEF